MINFVLLLSLITYIFTLVVGFRVAKNHKDELNKEYRKHKKQLYLLILASFIFSSAVFIQAQLWYIQIVNLVFIIYFLAFTFKEDRCWKQHRIILYHFFIIVLIYYASLVIENPLYNLYVMIIYIYNVLEFQFAKFNIKQALIWD